MEIQASVSIAAVSPNNEQISRGETALRRIARATRQGATGRA